MVYWKIVLSFLTAMASVVQGDSGSFEDPCSVAQTCQHIQKYQPIGFDYKGNSFLEIDVGKCTLEDQQLEVGSGLTPPTPCTCEATSYDHTTFLPRQGPYEHDTVTRCQATPLTACQRRPTHYTYHAHTSYQITVDLGRCSGSCHGSEKNCLPTSTMPMVVEGPSGPATYTKITGCGCGDNKCYRQDYYQIIQMLEEGNANTTRVIEKEVNVGVCTGECKGINIERCLYWENGMCLWGKLPTRAFCVPATTQDKEYIGTDGEKHTITSILSCHCGGLTPER